MHMLGTMLHLLSKTFAISEDVRTRYIGLNAVRAYAPATIDASMTGTPSSFKAVPKFAWLLVCALNISALRTSCKMNVLSMSKFFAATTSTQVDFLVWRTLNRGRMHKTIGPMSQYERKQTAIVMTTAIGILIMR
jgi:hypothetical protein